jgi:hypothetical protein
VLVGRGIVTTDDTGVLNTANSRELGYCISRADLESYARWSVVHLPSTRRRMRAWQGLFAVLIILPSLSLARLGVLAAAISILLTVAVWATLYRLGLPTFERQVVELATDAMCESKGFLGSWSLAFDPQGIRITGPAGEDRRVWSDMSRVEQDGRATYLVDNKSKALMIPGGAFDSDEATDDFRRYVATMIAGR